MGRTRGRGCMVLIPVTTRVTINKSSFHTTTMSLAKDISKLEEIRARLERVRNVPRQLLQPGGKGDFETIKELSEAVAGSEVQQALDRAMTSLKADSSGLTSKRAKRKRE